MKFLIVDYTLSGTTYYVAFFGSKFYEEEFCLKSDLGKWLRGWVNRFNTYIDFRTDIFEKLKIHIDHVEDTIENIEAQYGTIEVLNYSKLDNEGFSYVFKNAAKYFLALSKKLDECEEDDDFFTTLGVAHRYMADNIDYMRSAVTDSLVRNQFFYRINYEDDIKKLERIINKNVKSTSFDISYLDSYRKMLKEADMLSDIRECETSMMYNGESLDVVIVSAIVSETGDAVEATFHKGTETLIDLNIKHVCTCGHCHH